MKLSKNDIVCFNNIIEKICNEIDDELFESLSSGQIESMYLILKQMMDDE